MNKKVIITIGVVVLVAVGAYLVIRWTRSLNPSSSDSVATGTVSEQDLQGKNFVLASYNGIKPNSALRGADYTLHFGDGKISAKMCNSISGAYTLKNDRIEEDGAWMSTLIGCGGVGREQAEIESLFNSMMRKGVQVTLSGKELTLQEGSNRLVFEEQNTTSVSQQDLQSKSYNLVSLNGKTPSSRHSLQFKDGRLSMKVCNVLGGEFTLENNILRQKGPWSRTKVGCQDGEFEEAFLSMLSSGAQVALSGKDLTLREGENVLVFVEE
jgi:heat shock protein HslJ